MPGNESDTGPVEARPEAISGVSCFSWRPAGGQKHGRRNFGDELGPILVRRLLERHGVPAKGYPRDDRRLVSVGSVLHLTQANDVVWGAGVNGKVFRQSFPSTIDVRAVRGPLTRAILLGHGIRTPTVFGDPALLMPALFPEIASAPESDETLIIPNLNEIERFDDWDGDGVVLSPFTDPLEIVHRIAGAKMVIGSSLHAIILADAFGVASRAILPVNEHSLKYVDYYLGTGRAEVILASSIQHALDLGGAPAAEIDADALTDAFPWDMWAQGGRSRQIPVRAPSSFAKLRSDANAQLENVMLAVGWEMPPSHESALARVDQILLRGKPRDGITKEEAKTFGLALDHLRSRRNKPEITLSVVIPTNNVAAWLGETLRSVLAQDVSGMEVIIVDDHSSDGTQAVARKFATSDDRVQVLDAITGGGGSARNIGADHARGKYLAFCDGDDLVPVGAYQSLVQSLEKSGSDIAFGDYLKFSSTDTWRPTAGMPAFSTPKQGSNILDSPTLMYSRPCWNKVFLRDFWESREIRFPDVPRSNDIVPMTKAYLLAGNVDIVEDVVYLYRERTGATSMTAQSARAESTVSYFTQEAECAALVAGAHDSDLNKVYSLLVYDRDGFVHISKYLAAWDAPAAGDLAVSRALTRLLRTTPPPPTWVNPTKRYCLEFVSRGKFAAAVALLSLASDDAVENISVAANDWAEVVSALELCGPLHPDDYRYFAERIGAVLINSGLDIEDPALWEKLRSASKAVFKDELPISPQSGSEATRDPEAFRSLRAQVRGKITGVNGGGRLVLTGSAQQGPDTVTPVLYVPTSQTNGRIDPARVSWRESDEGFEWTAEYRAAQLPLHRAVVPAMRAVAYDIVLPVESSAHVPFYRASDAFLYRDVGNTVFITRRRSLVVRVARRGYLIAAARSSAAFRGLLGG